MDLLNGMKKNSSIGSVLVFLLLIALIIIIVMGFFIYKIYNEKNNENEKVVELQSQVNNLTGTLTFVVILITRLWIRS